MMNVKKGVTGKEQESSSNFSLSKSCTHPTEHSFFSLKTALKDIVKKNEEEMCCSVSKSDMF